jgi:hypothetical protein
MLEVAFPDLLHIYLNDHRAGAVAGLRVARRSAGANRGGPWGERLRSLAGEIAEDLQTLDAVMTTLEVRPNPVKRLGAVAGELAGRLKLNGRVVGYSPLSRVLEMEGLIAGIGAKASLWVALEATGSQALAAFDFPALVHRAHSQQDLVRELHGEAAAAAFGSASA